MTVDSPDGDKALARQLSEFNSTARNRGTRYFRGNRVSAVTRVDDQTVTGKVQGSLLYDVTLSCKSEQWKGRCTCPIGQDCKHVFALALAWRAELEQKNPTEFRLEGVPSLPAPKQRSVFDELKDLLSSKLGRTLTPAETSLLLKLAQLFQNFRRAGHVFSHELAIFGFKTGESSRPFYTPVFVDWWTSAPRDALSLWQYIAYDIETSGLYVPEFMRPVTDTAAIRQRLSNRFRQQSIARWEDRFNALANHAGPKDSLPASRSVFELRLRLGDSWALETRAGRSAPWKAAPKALVEQLVRGRATAFESVAPTTAAYALLALVQAHYQNIYSAIALSPRDGLAREMVYRLLLNPVARALVVDARGEPVTFAEQPLHWEIKPVSGPDRDYEIALYFPDGRKVPPSVEHFKGNPDLYLQESVVYRGPPALDGASATAALVPAEAIETPAALKAFRKFGARLPEEIEARFVTVPLRARIECVLARDFDDREILALELVAFATEPPSTYVRNQSGWGNFTTAPTSSASNKGKVVSHDFNFVDQIAALLPQLKVVYDPSQMRWVRRLNPSFPEEFIAWRESLPKGVEILATGELASLLGGPIRAHLDFELIEAAAHRDWFDLALALKPEDISLTAAELALLLKARGRLVRLPGKGWRRLEVHMDEATAAAVEAAGFDRDTVGAAALAGERHRFHALQLAQSGVADLLPERQSEQLRARARALARPAAPAISTQLHAELRPYQKEGFEFLAFLSANQLGGILADDMGLGKTVQTLAWLLWLAEHQPADKPLRVLVVCPKSVVGNWEAETIKFAPSLATVRYSPGISTADLAVKTPLLVLANYTQLRLKADFFQAQSWHVAVLDEGQFIKTPTSQVAQVARELRANHRVILTGTPIENRLLDLWSLFAFALPGLLGTQAAFKRQYSQDNPQALSRLRSRVRHFLLRRTKSQVAADLPPRTEEDVHVELEGTQRKLYDAELKRARAILLKVETSRELDKARFNILASLLRLRQICCHPALIDATQGATPSAKLDALMEMLDELRDEGHQVLVFSQFVTMLELIREKLVAAEIGHLMLTGQTENRDELVRQFQSDKSRTVFLLSLKAAGFGLNLTAASYVILYDPWWNPAVEAQAIDRTHRIGQSVPVNAYRFIAKDTVEEKIRALQKDKAALANAVVQEESLASVLDLDSLRQILG